MLSAAVAAFPGIPSYSGCCFDFLTDEDLNAFVYTQIASGTAAVIDTNGTGQNGILQFSSVDTTDNKGAQIQLDAEPFNINDGIDLFFVSRFALSDNTESDAILGLAITDTSLVASAPSDGIFFMKTDGGATVSLLTYAASALTNTISINASMVNDTYLTAGFKITDVVSGGANLFIYINGTLVTSTAITGLPQTEALSLSAAFQSGTNTAQTMNLDFIGAWNDRV